MILPLYTLVAQFGDGIEPIVPDSRYTDDSNVDTEVLGNVEYIISNILGVLTVLGTIFFIVYFITGAISWISAGGDSSKIGKARDQMVHAVLGLVVLVSSYIIIGLIGQVLGIEIFNIGETVDTLLPL